MRTLSRMLFHYRLRKWPVNRNTNSSTIEWGTLLLSFSEVKTMTDSECPSGHETFFVTKLDGGINYHWCKTCKRGYKVKNGQDEAK